MSTYQSNHHSVSSARASAAADPVAVTADTSTPAATAPERPTAARRYAPKQPGHSRPFLSLGAGHRQGALGLPWIGLRTSRRFGA